MIHSNDRPTTDPKDLSLIRRMAEDGDVEASFRKAFNSTLPYRYSYNWSWLGRPIIQYPQDIVAVQELIWRTKPDVVVETGIAHGGSLILSASILALLGGEREVIGVDIDIRRRNREAIEIHELAKRVTMIERSSIDAYAAAEVRERVADRSVMLILDSNHTAEHVATELELYSPLVQKSHYIIVFDTVIEHMPPESLAGRPWTRGNNPMNAVDAFLERNERFMVDEEYEKKLLMTAAPRGYLLAIA